VFRRLALAGCALVLAGCGAQGPTLTVPKDSTSLPAPPSISEVPVAQFSPHGKEVLAQARRDKLPTVVLVISTDQGATDRTAAALREIGGTVEAMDTTIGYVRVSMPVDEVEQAASMPGVSRVDVDEPIGYGDPTP
jgi:hypothetical protein